jgi:hypothetical protein
MLHNNYLEEIEKLKVIAKLQYEDGQIELPEFNKILFTLFDKIEIYKSSIVKVNLPKVDIKNYKSINVLQIIDNLLCMG